MDQKYLVVKYLNTPEISSGEGILHAKVDITI